MLSYLSANSIQNPRWPRVSRQDRDIAQWLRRERINKKHIQSIRSGKAGRRIVGDVPDTVLFGSLIWLGQKQTCRLIKSADDELDFTRNLRKSLVKQPKLIA
jgi:hypothetical protein